MILYLSGPITGVKDYKARFKHAQVTLTLAGRQTVLNPAVMPEGLKEYDDYLRIDLAMLEAADGIVMLPGWKKSNGAKMELRAALKARKRVFFGLKSVMQEVAPEAMYDVTYTGLPANLRLRMAHGEY